MSMAKRQQDLKDPRVRKRIEEYLKEVEMAELTVRSDGEEIVFGIPGGLEVRMSLAEVETFLEESEQAMDEATRYREYLFLDSLADWRWYGLQAAEDERERIEKEDKGRA